jgi:bifunctional non-homologous end joining protein LigD
MAVTTAEIVNIEGNDIRISNPEKLLWPNQKISKVQYLEKLLILAPFLLRYCRDRYLTTIRFPDGISKKSFYQKNCPEPKPDFVETALFNDINYVHLNSLSTLIWLGNLASLEFHPSFNYIEDPLPAEWLIDIDPSLEDEPRIAEAAWIVGETLRSLNIESIPKTSGATGIQIYVPILRGYTFEQLRKIGLFVGKYVTEQHPKLFTLERLKKHRGDLIYFDYLQHWHGKTLSAPYTPRAREFAPVSTPLLWDELKKPILPQEFNLFTIEGRLQEMGDLIAQVPPQSLDHVLEHLG